MILRNLLFYLGLIPMTCFFAVLGTLCWILPYPFRYRLITLWSYFFISWAKLTCGLKFEVKGLENLPTQNAILLSNHQSMWETIFLQTLLPAQTWVLKKELLSIPFFGWGLSLLQPIAIDRKSVHSVKDLIEQGKKYLTLGRWVVIFPEGTRVKPGVIHRYSKSGAALAEASGYPVVPMAHNAGLFWPKGYLIRKSGTIQVAIGKPLSPEGKTPLEINQAAESWIRKSLEAFTH